MTRKTTFDPDEAAECASLLGEITDRGQLAALALSQPVLVARRAQLEREQLRIRTRHGKEDPRVAALDTAIALAAARIDRVAAVAELHTVDTPAEPEEGGVIFGRVSEKGFGRADLVVSAVNADGKVVGFGCTGLKGAFEMKVPKGEGLRLRVTDKPGATLWRDRDPFDIDDGARIRREIDLGAAGPECPMPDDDTGEQPETAKVPDLVGRGEAEAQRLLLAAGLVRGKRSEEEDPDNVGRIVKQTPKAGSEVERGSGGDIVVGVESGLTMPDLTGVPLDEALAKIKDLGLQAADPAFAPSADFEGRVIQHTPVAGTKVKSGDTVTLLVGSKPKLTLPDLRGLKQAEAEKRLKELGLKAGEVGFVDDAEREGLVVRHTPLPGASVDPGSTVALFIGRKPEAPGDARKMPNLVGEPLDAALKVLAEMKLKASETTFVKDPEKAGQVIKQSPAAGKAVTVDSKIALTVASGKDERDIRSVVLLAAQDPAVEKLGLKSDDLLRTLKAKNVNSLDRLTAATASDAQVREVFGVDTAAKAKRLRAALRAVMAGMA
ncbi:MAG: PASTA domain-containing protein [Kiloniellaceae bacterium]